MRVRNTFNVLEENFKRQQRQPMFSRLAAIFFPLVLFSQCLDVKDVMLAQVQDQDEVYAEEEQTDEWYGPGFYFGIWFDNEDDYWGWRGNHRDYPSNRNYYHSDHPIHYDHHGGGDKGGSRSSGRSGGHGGGGHK